MWGRVAMGGVGRGGAVGAGCSAVPAAREGLTAHVVKAPSPSGVRAGLQRRPWRGRKRGFIAIPAGQDSRALQCLAEWAEQGRANCIAVVGLAGWGCSAVRTGCCIRVGLVLAIEGECLREVGTTMPSLSKTRKSRGCSASLQFTGRVGWTVAGRPCSVLAVAEVNTDKLC